MLVQINEIQQLAHVKSRYMHAISARYLQNVGEKKPPNIKRMIRGLCFGRSIQMAATSYTRIELITTENQDPVVGTTVAIPCR